MTFTLLLFRFRQPACKESWVTSFFNFLYCQITRDLISISLFNSFVLRSEGELLSEWSLSGAVLHLRNT